MAPCNLETSGKSGIGLEGYAQQESTKKFELEDVVVALQQGGLFERVVFPVLFLPLLDIVVVHNTSTSSVIMSSTKSWYGTLGKSHRNSNSRYTKPWVTFIHVFMIELLY